MILCCPFCGICLREGLKDGLASCSHCSRVFDTSPYHKLLSACWYVRKHQVGDVELMVRAGFSEPIALIAIAWVYEAHYNHDEIIKILTSMGITKNYIDINPAE